MPDWDATFVAVAVLWKLPTARAVELTGHKASVAHLAALPRPDRAVWVANTVRAALREDGVYDAPKSSAAVARVLRAEQVLPAPKTPKAQEISDDASTYLAVDAYAETGVDGPLARRVPAALVATEVTAQALLAEARAQAAAIVEAAKATVEAQVTAALAAKEAELAARTFHLYQRENAAETNALLSAEERIYDVAVALAETLLGEAVAIDPTKIGLLLDRAIATTSGARELRIAAHPEDAAVLQVELADFVSESGSPAPHGSRLTIAADASLSRGSLTVYTERGSLDARLSVQLRALVQALREPR